MKKTLQMRFKPEALGMQLTTHCKYCGCLTGPSGVCGMCKIFAEELEKEE